MVARVRASWRFLLETGGFQEAWELLLDAAGGRESEPRLEVAERRAAYFELQLCEWLPNLTSGRPRRLQNSAGGHSDMFGVPRRSL